MSNSLERSLDEIIGTPDSRPRSNRGPRRDHRDHSREVPRGPRSEGYRERDRYEPPRKTKLQRLSDGKAYLKIINLHPDINNEDLTQLFESVGKTSFTLIEADHSNRGSRLAYVGYEDVGLNEQAVEKFDGRKAVGQVITVEEIKPLNILSVSSNDRSRDHRSRDNGRGGRGRGSRGRGGRPNSAREPRKRATTEDLDKELENYMNSESTTSNDSKPVRRPKATVEDLDQELESYMDNRPFSAVN